jgi:spore coat polysaccharide biosynthesis protein SpsF (cytidylyltransferase family)
LWCFSFNHSAIISNSLSSSLKTISVNTNGAYIMVHKSNPRVVGVVQARLGSKRLPRKSLADISGQPMMVRVAERLYASGRLDAVGITTSQDANDDMLEHVAHSAGLFVSRGPVDDIVRRLYLVAEEFEADYLVRAWGDCPLLPPEVVALAVDICRNESLAYVSNGVFRDRTYPPGTDVEVYSYEAIRYIERHANIPEYREFPAEFVRANSQFLSMKSIQMTNDFSQLYLAVDYAEDLEAVRVIYEELKIRDLSSSMEDLLKLFTISPELADNFSCGPRNIEFNKFIQTTRADL